MAEIRTNILANRNVHLSVLLGALAAAGACGGGGEKNAPPSSGAAGQASNVTGTALGIRGFVASPPYGEAPLNVSFTVDVGGEEGRTLI